MHSNAQNIFHVNRGGLVPIQLGATQRESVYWDPARIINGHMSIAGMSGSGKSHFLRGFVNALVAANNVRVHVYDIHGDLDMQDESVVSFTEQSEFGLNPLVVDADEEFGGVRRRIQSLINMLNKTARQLGPKQEAVLRNLLLDLYAANGFYPDNPASWKLDDGIPRRWAKKYPTFDDAYRFAFNKLKSMYMGGTGAKATSALANCEKSLTAMRRKITEQKEPSDADKATIDDAKHSAIEAFTDYVWSLETGKELEEVIKYDSRDTLKSVVDRLENLRATGLFKGKNPPFNPARRVWRRKLNTLSIEERKLFVLLDLLERFMAAVRGGITDELRELLVLDEAHAFIDDDPDSPINTIVREARKFGVGLVLASQTPADLPDSVLSSMGTKIILKIDEMYYGPAARRLGVDVALLKSVQPRSTALIQTKKPGDASNSYDLVKLGL